MAVSAAVVELLVAMLHHPLKADAPHEHESKGSDAPAVPKARAWTGMFGSGAPAVPKARA